MFRILLVVALVGWAGLAHAAAELRFAPPADWVTPVAPADRAADPAAGGAVQILLSDSQVRYTAEGEERYRRSVARVLAPQALSALGSAGVVWNPDTDTVTVHTLTVTRDGETTDVLKSGKTFTILRREQGLEAAFLDGALTATLQIEDLRVGDVVEMATTTLHSDPVLQGRSESANSLLSPFRVERLHVRRLWSEDKPIRWRAGESAGDFKLVRSGAGVELVLDAADVAPRTAPEGAPTRFIHVADLELSEFTGWSQVSSLMAPLYDKASTLAADSPLHAEIARIRAAHPDQKGRAAAALRLVQEQVRYVFLGMNFGGYTPAAADVTWQRRFADCKGKTALLLALLNGLGVPAQAAMVSTADGDGLDQRLPRLGSFDHVIVRAVVGGEVYWLDGTKQDDRTLDGLVPPNVRWALPVAADGAALEAIAPDLLVEPSIEEALHVDLSAGATAPAKIRLEMVARGDQGRAVWSVYRTLEKSEMERRLMETWRDKRPWARPTAVSATFDETSGELRVRYDAEGVLEWEPNGSVRELLLWEASLGWNASYDRAPGPAADAPFAVAFPHHTSRSVTMVLPEGVDGFSLVGGGDFDRTLAGYHLKRTARLAEGRVSVSASMRGLVREVAAVDARRDAAAIRELARSPVVLRASTAALVGVPTDPSQRGLAALMAGRYEAAIADLTRAAEAEPTAAKHRYNRGVAYFQSRLYPQAQADFEAALRLQPDHLLALQGRAETRLARGQVAAADTDYDLASRRAPGDVMIRVRRAEAYDRHGLHDRAVALFDQLLVGEHSADRKERLLVGQCRALAHSTTQAGRALTACDQLLLGTSNPEAREARGVARLRAGRLDEAITDFDLLVRTRERTGAALYGRGLARLRKGLAKEGEADLVAARAADPGIAETFARFGLAP